MAPLRKKQRLSNGTVAAAETIKEVEALESSTETDQKELGKQRRSLFIRSLPANTTTESLTALFSESYPIKHATAVIDPATKQCRGYGFVSFADAEDAQSAKAEFNGHVLDGRKLRIEIAEPRHRDSGDKDPAVETAQKERVEVEKVDRQPPKLIVRNLPWTIKTSDQLAKLFMSYGKIKQAYIPKAASGLLAGFGFVLLRGKKNAGKAIEGVNGKEVDGRTLAVDWAVKKDVYEGLMKDDSGDGLDEQVQGAPHDGEGEMTDGDQDKDMVTDDDSERAKDIESQEDEDDEDLDDQLEHNGETHNDKTEDRSATLFIRNLPFMCTDEDLEDHFSQFGSTRYARVVMDPGTERSKGTGFVCFYNKTDADTCLRGAPRRVLPTETDNSKDTKMLQASNSILQNEHSDPSGEYTIDGRVLQVSRAVDKSEANRLTEEGVAHRYKRNEDKRRLYLLSEGTIPTNSKLWENLSPSERTMREASVKQRKTLIESNPSLHLSLTRLSVRNIPRSVGSKELKALARRGIVGFATDVKAGVRQKLSKEELDRGGEEMHDAEQARKKAGKGVVKQAKVVFEGAGGSKVSEDSGAGRSRGYGFIEYHTHRNALMGLRWLNGHAVGYQVKEGKKAKVSKDEIHDRKKRLIVEFAIENAQVVMRRKGKEDKAKERSEAVKNGVAPDTHEDVEEMSQQSKPVSRKRRRGSETSSKLNATKSKTGGPDEGKSQSKAPIDEKIARRNQIIGRKRAMRRARSGGKP